MHGSAGSLEGRPCSGIMLCKSHGKRLGNNKLFGIPCDKGKGNKEFKNQVIRVVIYHVANVCKWTSMFVNVACE